MAVYTKVNANDLEAFLKPYALAAESTLTEIAEGVENSNFLLHAGKARYILTIFEKRVEPADLPWFFSLMTHLRQHGIACPEPLRDRDGRVLNMLHGKMAVITSFLHGRPATTMTNEVCFQAGRFLAQIHVAAKLFQPVRSNNFGAGAWTELSDACRAAVKSSDDYAARAEVDALALELGEILPGVVAAWPKPDALPSGPIHADFFPDNVFFQRHEASGVIDFYFAATDHFVFDLAIAMNAWCFPDSLPEVRKLCRAILTGYESIRPLSSVEKTCLPLLAKGAALRFTLTRLYDWMHTPKDALVTPKDPRAFKRIYDIWSREDLEVF